MQELLRTANSSDREINSNTCMQNWKMQLEYLGVLEI